MQDDRPDDEEHAGGLFGPDGLQATRGRRRKRQPASTTQRALGLLVRREHSRKELTRKLVGRGLDAEEVAAAVDKLAEAGWQDDTRFAESLVRNRANSGYGPVHIQAELGTHGLDSEAVAAAMESFEGDWLDNARDLVRRRYREGLVDDPSLRRKAADLLMRRGFPGDIVRAATRFDPDD
jgi:regulatory protein